MKKYRYTFLVPAYKIEYFEAALRSMVGQSYRNFKIIVSDDCSPMPLHSVFEKVQADYNLEEEQLVYRRTNLNIGGVNLVEHWNALVDECDTDFLIMASDDDLYAPNFLEEIDKLTFKYPLVDMYCTRVKRINEDDVVTAQDAPTVEFEKQIDFLYGLYVLRRLKCIGNYVFRTSSIKKFGGFVKFPYAWGSDDITVSAMSKNGVGITSGVLFSFRLSGKNISSTQNSRVTSLKVKARMQNVEWFEQFVKKINADDSLLSKSRLASYEEFYRREWIGSIIANSEFLEYKQLKNTFRWLVRHGGLRGIIMKAHLFWTWIRAAKVRK